MPGHAVALEGFIGTFAQFRWDALGADDADAWVGQVETGQAGPRVLGSPYDHLVAEGGRRCGSPGSWRVPPSSTGGHA